ncbi:hypothetical protein D9M70_408670 [compost metagenome]
MLGSHEHGGRREDGLLGAAAGLEAQELGVTRAFPHAHRSPGSRRDQVLLAPTSTGWPPGLTGKKCRHRSGGRKLELRCVATAGLPSTAATKATAHFEIRYSITCLQVWVAAHYRVSCGDACSLRAPPGTPVSSPDK